MEMTRKIATAMVALGVCARLLPHPWNFTPMVAIGLYTGAQATKLRTGLLVTVLALLLSDLILGLGFYRGMWYVYAASLIPVLIGRLVRRAPGAKAIALGTLSASLSFFLTTNFMVWAASGLYPRTVAGLGACFVAALPFYQNQVLGDAFFTAALFGGHALMIRLLQPAPRTA